MRHHAKITIKHAMVYCVFCGYDVKNNRGCDYFRWLLELIQKGLILNYHFTRKTNNTPPIVNDSLSNTKMTVLYLNHLKVCLL